MQANEGGVPPPRPSETHSRLPAALGGEETIQPWHVRPTAQESVAQNLGEIKTNKNWQKDSKNLENNTSRLFIGAGLNNICQKSLPQKECLEEGETEKRQRIHDQQMFVFGTPVCLKEK